MIIYYANVISLDFRETTIFESSEGCLKICDNICSHF